MTGARKAALLLVSLGQDRAARIVQALHNDEVEQVMAEIANLGPVDEPLVNQVMKDFIAQAQRQSRAPQGGAEVARDLLSQALGSTAKAEAIMARIGGAPVGTHFRALTALDSAVAASVLAHEHPQTIALVLSKLPPDRALAMLRELPESNPGRRCPTGSPRSSPRARKRSGPSKPASSAASSPPPPASACASTATRSSPSWKS